MRFYRIDHLRIEITADNLDVIEWHSDLRKRALTPKEIPMGLWLEPTSWFRYSVPAVQMHQARDAFDGTTRVASGCWHLEQSLTDGILYLSHHDDCVFAKLSDWRDMEPDEFF